MLSMKAIIRHLLDAVKADYITEQGTSGAWHYRIWKSGRKEAWFYAAVGNVSVTRYNYYVSGAYTYSEVIPIAGTILHAEGNATTGNIAAAWNNVYIASGNKLAGYLQGLLNATGSGQYTMTNVRLSAYVVLR